MARSILEIAREAAERDATAPAPSKLFGVNDRIAKVLRHAAKDTLREYLRSSGWQGLSEFHSSWVFALRPNRYAYPMPTDFLRLIPETETRYGHTLGMLGPVTPQTWSNWLFGRGTSPSAMGWRIRNNALFIEPVPSKSELVVIEYISRYPVVSEIQANDYDMSMSPPQTNAPIVPRDGFLSLPDESVLEVDFEDEGHYGEDPGWDFAKWADDPMEYLRRINPLSGVAPLPQVRRPEFVADTDMPVFEDDYLLSLGMTFRLRRALGLPYTEHAAEYESELEMKGSTDAGGARSFRMGEDTRQDQVMPLGNGEWLLN